MKKILSFTFASVSFLTIAWSYVNNKTIQKDDESLLNKEKYNGNKRLEEISKKINKEILSQEFAEHMDKEDKLASFRDKFLIPYKKPKDKESGECIYLCGNSLGLQPKTTRQLINEELDDWENFGVDGHFPVEKGQVGSKRPWLITDDFVREQAAKIVGAKPIEVVVMNSLTVNLHLMMVPFYRPNGEKRKILIEGKSFPSDHYAVLSQLNFHGYKEEDLIQVFPRKGESSIRTSDILDIIEKEGDKIALVLFSGVQYYTGQFFEIEKITKAGHNKGCIVGFDLAHAAGNIDLKLHDWDVDFAVWCSYKYLNSGPGGIAGAFVHERHANNKSLKRFAGWWGHNLETRFQMDAPFDPIPGAYGFRISNPPVFQIAAFLSSAEIFVEAGMENLRQKSLLLTGFLEFLLYSHFKDEITILTPMDENQRGCQLSLFFKSGISELHDKMHELGVVCDVRKPNVIRVAPCPLYNRFVDVWNFFVILKQNHKI
eukprot:TRINITY_DN7333_c0_g1_i1.p1 TRINITY_DN7333_c0_g1~~TRINITY_DN7333_c0_g1_i1.p1  ORF type:complete len:486 (+),score=135.96 TRINITY_DN7333_c0_g1_i1:61-1518(+)